MLCHGFSLTQLEEMRQLKKNSTPPGTFLPRRVEPGDEGQT